MTANQEACRHFLVFFSSVEDNDKPATCHRLLVFFPQMSKMTTSWEAPGSLSSLGVFSNVNSLVASPPNASLLYFPIHGDVTTSYHTTPLKLYPKLLHKTHIFQSKLQIFSKIGL